jgi:hypothetical protein
MDWEVREVTNIEMSVGHGFWKSSGVFVALHFGRDRRVPRQGSKPEGADTSCGCVDESPAPKADARQVFV